MRRSLLVFVAVVLAAATARADIGDPDRLAAYTDYEGWTNKEFLGRGEFTLEFGNYEVEMTLPADHIVSSTGTLQNPNQVLTSTQRDRLREAEDAARPVFIVTAEEALENEKEGTDDTKTWRFKAENVRDFAWASSRNRCSRSMSLSGSTRCLRAASCRPPSCASTCCSRSGSSSTRS